MNWPELDAGEAAVDEKNGLFLSPVLPKRFSSQKSQEICFIHSNLNTEPSVWEEIRVRKAVGVPPGRKAKVTWMRDDEMILKLNSHDER